MTEGEFVSLICRMLCQDLIPIQDMRKFTSNNDLYGAFAEARVRQFVRRFVAPLRVSHGAIAHEGNCGEGISTPQIDTIIWQPSPVPAIFEADDFAIVPRGSAVAYMEIKSTPYSLAAVLSIAKCLALERELLFEVGASGNTGYSRSLGVFCYTKEPISEEVQGLIDRKEAVILLDISGGTQTVRVQDVTLFAQFLGLIRLEAKLLDGKAGMTQPGEGIMLRQLKP